MNITLEKSLCTKCSFCIKSCPVLHLRYDESGFPAENGGMCVECGHCEAVCPEKAIYLWDSPSDLSAYNLDNSSQKKSEIISYLKSRRSIRQYQKKTADAALINEIFDTVRYAPTGRNRQEIRWIVLSSGDVIKAFLDKLYAWLETVPSDSPVTKYFDPQLFVSMYKNGVDMICRNAPHIALTYSDKSAGTYITDSAIAMTYLDVLLPVYGMGGCWAGYLQFLTSVYPMMHAELGIPPDHAITGCYLFGYPVFKYRGIPKRNAASVTIR